MKRVFLDSRMLSPKMHGIARYAWAILRSLGEKENKTYEIFSFVRSGYQSDPWFQEAKKLPIHWIETESKFLSLNEWVEIPKLLKQKKADLFHSPSFAFFPFLPCAYTITLHDLIHLGESTSLKNKIYYAGVKKFAKKSKVIFTVSEHSKNEILKWLGSRAPSIEICPDMLEPPLECEILNQKKQYFLSLSNPKAHKNMSFLFSAYEKYRVKCTEKKIEPLELWVEESFRAHSVPEGVRFFHIQDEKDFEKLIRNAKALLSPSLEEGLGLPPLEALFRGVPVITSSIPSHLESRDRLPLMARYWDLASPHDQVAWINALFNKTIEIDVKIPIELQKNAWTRYSYQNLGETVHRVYLSVLGL